MDGSKRLLKSPLDLRCLSRVLHPSVWSLVSLLPPHIPSLHLSSCIPSLMFHLFSSFPLAFFFFFFLSSSILSSSFFFFLCILIYSSSSTSSVVPSLLLLLLLWSHPFVIFYLSTILSLVVRVKRGILGNVVVVTVTNHPVSWLVLVLLDQNWSEQDV